MRPRHAASRDTPRIFRPKVLEVGGEVAGDVGDDFFGLLGGVVAGALEVVEVLLACEWGTRPAELPLLGDSAPLTNA